MRKVFGILALLLILTSCTVTESLAFDSKEDFDGSSYAVFCPDSFFISVMEDLTSWQETDSSASLMDTAVIEFRKNVQASDTTSDLAFYKYSDNEYSGSFKFNDFETLLEDLTLDYPDQKLMTIKTTEWGNTRFEINLSLETYDVLTSVVPFLNDENFKVWGPVYNNAPYDEITEEDYKDMVSWVLGEEGPDSIDASSISITLHLPSDVISTNGEKLGSKDVCFSFPLIDFLLLHNPIVFWCEF